MNKPLEVIICECGHYQLRHLSDDPCPKCGAVAYDWTVIEADAIYMIRSQKERWTKEEQGNAENGE